MTEVESYSVSLTDEDNRTTYYLLIPSRTTLATSDGSNPLIVDVGRVYVVVVQTVNSVGTSEMSSTTFGELNCILLQECNSSVHILLAADILVGI